MNSPAGEQKVESIRERKVETINDSVAFKNRGKIGVILFLPIVVAVSFSSPVVARGGLLDLFMDALGWLSFGLYLTFRIWATLYIGGRKDKELQTRGPYSVTRNPLYFGSLCFALSAAFFFKSLSFFLMICTMGVIYLTGVIRAEERFLEKKFGKAFRDFAQRTPRLFPAFSHYTSDDSVDAKMIAIKAEARRLWLAILLPISAEIIMYLRMTPWWPHWFTLP
ncbi:MAG TPA: isoprenylcysteine carboxylmethyltransferase family protein [Candidatus Manganitrophaceae bacterium]|nr:isoprenylcysteine carboxylmethyltransferase family protein [Candidatus Manganitrophaceae bacterium]